MYRATKSLWQLIILVAGVTVVALGIILLVLPGPGLLVIFLGLLLLSTEFAWAHVPLNKIRHRFEHIIERFR